MTARAAEPALTETDLVAMIEDNTGVPRRMTSIALACWSAYPLDVDALVEHAQRAEADGIAADGRTHGLLSS